MRSWSAEEAATTVTKVFVLTVDAAGAHDSGDQKGAVDLQDEATMMAQLREVAAAN